MMAFTPVSYRIATVIGMVFTSAAGFFLTKYMGLSTALVVAPLSMVVIALIDYFAFSGISTRKEKCMELMKSSFYGTEILCKAMKLDIILKMITMVLCFMGSFIGCILYEAGILLVLSALFATMAVTALTLIFTRRKGLSIVVHTMIIYFMSMVLNGVLLALLLSMVEGITDVTQSDTTFTNVVVPLIIVGLAALAVLFGILLYRDCVKGYESGFCDNSETGVEK